MCVCVMSYSLARMCVCTMMGIYLCVWLYVCVVVPDWFCANMFSHCQEIWVHTSCCFCAVYIVTLPTDINCLPTMSVMCVCV